MVMMYHQMIIHSRMLRMSLGKNIMNMNMSMNMNMNMDIKRACLYNMDVLQQSHYSIVRIHESYYYSTMIYSIVRFICFTHTGSHCSYKLYLYTTQLCTAWKGRRG